MAETFDRLLKNAIVVNHDGTGPRDIGIRDGKIAAIGSLSGATAGEVTDCTGLHILPGVIDSQVHFREPGLEWKDDLAHGADGAALGGVTAVFEMPNTNPTTTDPAALEDKLNRAKGRMRVDHAFYVGGTHENTKDLTELEQLPGCCGVKVFMGASTGPLLVHDDDGVRAVLKAIRRRAAFHAEDEYRLEERRSLARTGDWTSHPEVRDPVAALMATERLIRIAREVGGRIHILHISTAEEVPLIAANKDVATCEVTPQHLTLEAPEVYQRLKGFAQMNPPVREAHHIAGLWQGVTQGVFDVTGSDHAPHTREEKAKPYPASPSGMPGVQTLVPVFLNHVNSGRLTLERFVDLTSHGPNRVFGIAGKGRIAKGYDADFTIVDMKAERVIDEADTASKCGWTPFHGMKITGWPLMTIVRGRDIMRDGELIGAPAGNPVRFQETLSPA